MAAPPPTGRAILHVDMDAFFASVEQRDNPALRGKPVLVGGTSNRGVVAAASYEARQFGVRSAMPIRRALQRCPDAICVRSRIDHYRDVSRQIFAIFRSLTPDVEGLSLDEAFLDVSRSVALFGAPVDIAQAIKARIRESLSLTASVGVAANKLVAKIASDLDKPDGLTVIPAGTEPQRLAELPVAVLPGIGPKMADKLAARGIRRIHALQQASDADLQLLFGRYAQRMRERAHGIDARPVISARGEKSVSAETTFSSDIDSPTELRRIVGRLADRTASRLRRKALLAGVVQLKIRQSDFQTFSRQAQLQPASNNTQVLASEASALLDEWRAAHPGQKLRLLGVGAAALRADQQLDLFAADARADTRRVDQTVDAVRERFSELGIEALQSARALTRDDSERD